MRIIFIKHLINLKILVTYVTIIYCTCVLIFCNGGHRPAGLRFCACSHLVELLFREPGNIWSCKVFLLNHIDYVSLNSNPWDGNAPSLGNSWEPRKSKMAAVIPINYKMCLSLHYIMLET